MRVLVLLVATVLSPCAGLADTAVFRNALIVPIAGPAIEQGALVIEAGKILAIGPSASITTPSGASETDLSGKVLMPGMVDTHSHIGGPSGGDASAPLNPEVRSLDAIDVFSDGFWRARAGGITTLNVMPGSGHVMSGQTTYLKLRKNPRRIEDWLFCDDPTNDICGSMKMANGTNSIREKPFPGTRAKSAAFFVVLGDFLFVVPVGFFEALLVVAAGFFFPFPVTAGFVILAVPDGFFDVLFAAVS